MFHRIMVDERGVEATFVGAMVVGALLAGACVDKGTKDDATPPDKDREAGVEDSPRDVDGSISIMADGGAPDSSQSGSSQDNLTVVLEETSEDTSLDVTLDTTSDAGEQSTETEAGPSTLVTELPTDAGGDATTDADADAPGCSGEEITSGSHVFFQFDALNGEWVTSLSWQDSTETLTGNLVGYGGGPGCSSPFEFFGQAFAAPEGNGPYPVGGNSLTSVVTCGLDQNIELLALDCTEVAQTPVATSYHFYNGSKADQVRITRTLGFDSDTPLSTGVGMRVYTPRPAYNALPNVIIPNGNDPAGISVASSLSCGGDCFTEVGESWNGQWFADVNPDTGLAMIVLRDAGLTTPVSLTVNNDSSSGTNVSSFVVLQPPDGWKEPLTEVEYLCFADLTTWPQVDRDAAVLPAFCGP